MKQSRFSLADVITFLVALAFGFVCFLGMNFYTLGDISQSITLGIIITVLLGGTAYAAKSLKRVNRNFKTSFVLEIIMLTLFTGFTAFFAYTSFPHYFNVTARKTEIQSKINNSIMQATGMFAQYDQYAEDRLTLYERRLETVAGAQHVNPSTYRDYGFVNNVANSTQIDNKLFSLRAELFPSHYSDSTSGNGIKEIATDWLVKARSTTNNWRPIGVVSVVNAVEKNSQEWLGELIGFSSVRAQYEEATDFVHPLLFDDVKARFTTKGTPKPFSILLAVGAYVLMLLSYLISKRSSKTSVGTSKERGKYDIEF